MNNKFKNYILEFSIIIFILIVFIAEFFILRSDVKVSKENKEWMITQSIGSEIL